MGEYARVSGSEDIVLNDMAKNLLLWLIIAAVLLMVFQNFNMQPQREQLNYTDFLHEVQQERVRKVVIDGLLIVGERQDGRAFETCLLYTSDAADERSSVDLGGRRIIKKKNREASVACYETGINNEASTEQKQRGKEKRIMR